MLEIPLSVAIGVVIRDRKILLLKRVKGSYVGFWGLPGGKIEKQEHVSEAAVREIEEETGLPSVFKEHLGFVSEHLIENGVILQHFLLHLCHLEPRHTRIQEGKEGGVAWFDFNTLEQNKDIIIPSDYLMIKRLVLSKGRNYFNCVVEKRGEEHKLVAFS